MIPWIDNGNGLVDGWRGTNGLFGVGAVLWIFYPAMRGSFGCHCDIRVLFFVLEAVDIVT